MAYLGPSGGRMNVSLGGNTAGALSLVSSGTLQLYGGNNITLSQYNGNTITIHGAGGGAALSAGTQSINTGTVNFANSNGITFGMSGSSQVTASHNGLTTQSNQALSASNGSFAFQTAGFSNANGVTFGTSAGSIMTASVNTSYAASNHSHGNPTLNLTNLSGTTASASNGLTLSLSAAAPGAGAAISAAGASASNGTVVFSNSNGLAFGMNGSTVTGSYTVPTQSNQSLGIYATGVNTTGQSSSNTLDARSFSISAQGGLYAGMSGNTLQLSAATTYAASNHSHGNPTLALTNLSGTTASASNGLTLSLSAAAPGGGGAVISNSQTGYSTGTINLVEGSGAITINSTTGQQFKFNVPGTSSLVGTNGISVSSAGNVISIDGNGLSTIGGGATLSYYNPQDAYLQVTGQQGQGTLHVQPSPMPNVAFDRFAFPVVFTGATGSTASITISMWAGIYTRNASSLSLMTSYSTSNSLIHSGTANSSQNVGLKLLTMGASSSFSEGAYYVGILSRTTSGGANATISQILASQQNSNFAGLWGQAVSATQQYTRGLGVYTATTAAIPTSIAFSQLNGTASNVLRQPMFYLVNGTF